MILCRELTWNQVFIAIDDLSRTGQVGVTLDGDRTYRVQAQLRRAFLKIIAAAGGVMRSKALAEDLVSSVVVFMVYLATGRIV